MTRARCAGAILVLVLIAHAAQAASYVVRPDAALVDAADAVVVPTVLSSQSRLAREGLILTDHVARVDETLKGELAAGVTIAITEVGGAVGDLALVSSSAPRFVAGERALLLLDRRGSAWSTLDGQLGKFNFVRDASAALLLVRGAGDEEIFGWDVWGGAHVERPRDAEAFLRFIRGVARGEAPAPDYFREASGKLAIEGPVEALSSFSPNAYLMQFGFTDPGGARWPAGAFTMGVQGTPSGATAAATAQAGASTWNDDPTSNITITIAGTASTINYGTSNGSNIVHFGVPSTFSYQSEGKTETPLSGNVVGQALLWATSNQHTFRDERFYTAAECDIVLETSLSGALLHEVTAHEMGHCLGLRHSNEGTPGSETALMNSIASGRGNVLLDWDREAANSVYGDGTYPCDPASIEGAPQSVTINQGQSAALVAVAGGTAPVAYQWFLDGTAIPGATAPAWSTGPLPAGSYRFALRVSNACNTQGETSADAIVSIVCAAPTILSQPGSVTVQPGRSITLSVSALGATSIQWFRGARGDESQPVGTGSLLPLTPAVSATYWAKLASACGSVASDAASVVVSPSATSDRRRTLGRS